MFSSISTPIVSLIMGHADFLSATAIGQRQLEPPLGKSHTQPSSTCYQEYDSYKPQPGCSSSSLREREKKETGEDVDAQ
jgi:hypothetical protein